jgi:hypothetical protein
LGPIKNLTAWGLGLRLACYEQFMKKLLAVIFACAFWHCAFGQTMLTNLGVGQSFTIVESGSSYTNVSLQVASNQVLEIDGLQTGPVGVISFTVPNLPGQTIPVTQNLPAGGQAGVALPSASLPAPLKLAGPLTVNFTWNGTVTYIGYYFWATCKLIGNAETGGSTQSIPSTAVVIPTDATGPVQIVLESSQDLVNWVPALPGTYGAITTNRFFRVRAIAQ